MSFLVLVTAFGIGAFQPDPGLRRIGWAIGFIAFAALQIALARVLWIAHTDNRVDFMARAAREAIDYTRTPDIDREWRELDDNAESG
jgi:hypothetical protein